MREQIEKRIDLDFPSLIIIDGGQGQGKTTLMIHLIDHINKIKGVPPASLSKKDHPQLALGGKEFTKNFNICKQEGLPVIGYDEAGDFSRRGSMGRFNAMINRRFETFRSSKIIVILCLPNFNILDNHLFDLQVPRLFLHLLDREATRKYGNFSAYSLYQMNWVRYWYEKLPKATRYKCYDKSIPNFRGHFLNLPEERAKRLKIISDMGKDRESINAEIKAEGLLSMEDLRSKIGRSHVWIYDAFKKLHIKHLRKINRVNYYSKDVVDLLLDHLERVQNKEYE